MKRVNAAFIAGFDMLILNYSKVDTEKKGTNKFRVIKGAKI